MRRLFARLALTAAVVCVGAAAWPAPHATAAEAVQSAYWWRAQAAPAPLPIAPQGVPDRGLYVASDPTGPEAVAAVRARVPVGATPVTLSLVAVSSTGTGAALEACATSGWTPTTGAGQWAQRPTSTCAPAVQGVQSADGVTWFFPVTTLVRAGVLDVLIQPATTGVFSDSFARPTADSVGYPVVPVPSAAQPGGATVPAGPPVRATSPSSIGPTGRTVALPPVIGSTAAASRPQVAPVLSPSPAAANATAPIGSRRSIFAVVAVLLVAAAWLLRTRGAVSNAAAHPLAQPLQLRARLAEHTLAGDSS